MALLVWLPLNGDLKNYGVSNWLFSNTASATVSTSGKIGSCYSFASTTGAGLFSSDSGFMDKFINNKSFTLSAWVKTSESDTIVLSLSYGLRMFAGSSPSTSFYNSSRIVNAAGPSGASVSDGKWHHMACTYSTLTNNITMYIDGVGKTTPYTSGYTYASSWTNGLFIGRDPNNNTPTAHYFFLGSLDDIRIYDECLSDEQVREISKGLVAHYPLNDPNFNENLIFDSKKVTSGGDATGITSSYEPDGSLKVIAESDNANWRSIGFARDSNANIGSKLSVGDSYSISVDVKLESGSGNPQLFINEGNSYKRLLGSLLTGSWIRLSYSSTWADPGTSYGNISLHLGFSGLVGTWYFKNFKLEKSSTASSWSPAPSDSGAWPKKVYDTSGYQRHGTILGTLSCVSGSPRYLRSVYFDTSSSKVLLPVIPFSNFGNSYTFSWWQYNVNTGNMPWGFADGNRLNPFHTTNLCWNTGDGGSNPFINGSTTIPSESLKNAWHHMAITGDGTTTKIYIDGLYRGNATTYKALTGTQVYISGWDSSTGYNMAGGKEVDFRIYSTALSESDIKHLYANPISVTNTGSLMTQGEVVEE